MAGNDKAIQFLPIFAEFSLIFLMKFSSSILGLVITSLLLVLVTVATSSALTSLFGSFETLWVFCLTLLATSFFELYETQKIFISDYFYY
jgi:hypothetical protein